MLLLLLLHASVSSVCCLLPPCGWASVSLYPSLLPYSGAAASITRAGTRALKGICKRRLLTSLEVPIRDPAYPWVMQWLVAKYARKHKRSCCCCYRLLLLTPAAISVTAAGSHGLNPIVSMAGALPGVASVAASRAAIVAAARGVWCMISEGSVRCTLA